MELIQVYSHYRMEEQVIVRIVVERHIQEMKVSTPGSMVTEGLEKGIKPMLR